MNIKSNRSNRPEIDIKPSSISKNFKNAIMEYPETLSNICDNTGMNISRLSRILNGRELPHKGDQKLIKVAIFIGFPIDQIFD